MAALVNLPYPVKTRAAARTITIAHVAQRHWFAIDDPLGIEGTQITGINKFGEIVGFYTDGSGLNHGFFAMPGGVPEPSTWAMMLIGFLILGVGRLTHQRAR